MQTRRQFVSNGAALLASLAASACARRPVSGNTRGATPMGSQKTSVRSPDGTTIAFSRSGSGEPLVLVHGTTADRSRWRPILPQLESRFTVYAVDRRGRGGSGDVEPYALAREFEDVAAVVDSIGGAVNLLGHSHGAICSLEGALLAKNVKRLALYEPPIYVGTQIYPPEIVGRLRELLVSGERERVLRTFFTEVVRMPPHDLQRLETMSSWRGRVAAAHTIVREIEANNEYRLELDRLGRLNMPTLLLLGRDSPPFFRLAIEQLGQTIRNNRIVVLPGQQHNAMDTAPELFIREIVQFFSA